MFLRCQFHTYTTARISIISCTLTFLSFLVHRSSSYYFSSYITYFILFIIFLCLILFFQYKLNLREMSTLVGELTLSNEHQLRMKEIEYLEVAKRSTDMYSIQLMGGAYVTLKFHFISVVFFTFCLSFVSLLFFLDCCITLLIFNYSLLS